MAPFILSALPCSLPSCNFVNLIVAFVVVVMYMGIHTHLRRHCDNCASIVLDFVTASSIAAIVLASQQHYRGDCSLAGYQFVLSRLLLSMSPLWLNRAAQLLPSQLAGYDKCRSQAFPRR